MESTRHIRSTKSRLIQRYLALLLVLPGMPVPVAAQLPQESDATEAQAQSSPVQTSYRIVNLCCGPLFGAPVINDRGQVAYAAPLGTTNGGAWFYDGERRHAIGNLGRRSCDRPV